MPPKPFKIVLIADIHRGEDKIIAEQNKRLSSRAMSLLKYTVGRINKDVQPEFVVQLGNLIEDDDAELDLENYAEVLTELRQVRGRVYCAIGDCDQANLNLKQLCSLLERDKPYYSFDAGSFHFIVLFAASEKHGPACIGKSQQQWLEEDLAATEKKCIVFSHYPLDDQDLAGNFWFENAEDYGLLEDRVVVRDVLARSGKVRAVFNGHVHRNNIEEIGGIHYVSIQSLVENISETRKVPSESYAIVSLTEDLITVQVEGMDPAEFRI